MCLKLEEWKYVIILAQKTGTQIIESQAYKIFELSGNGN